MFSSFFRVAQYSFSTLWVLPPVLCLKCVNELSVNKGLHKY